MDTITSAQFRKAYAKLTEPVIVTANGHPIGTWTPGINYEELPRAMLDKPFLRPAAAAGERFNTQPFRGPIPKKR